MLKVRLQGTTNDIKWFRKILERNRKVKLLSFSEPYIVDFWIFQKGLITLDKNNNIKWWKIYIKEF